MVISLKVGQNYVLVLVIVEGLLFDGHLDNLLRTILFFQQMRNLIFEASKVDGEVEVVLKEIVRSIEIILRFLYALYFQT